MKNSGDNRSLKMPVFQNPRSSTVYLIFQGEKTDLKKMYNTLDVFVEISPTPTRPKCLLILYNDQDWPENDLKQVLFYGWSLKFLDFSVIQINSVNHIICFSYNPFMNTYSKDLEMTYNVFPDKLNNMNNYSIILPVYNYSPPYLFVYNEANGKTIINGSEYLHLETVAKKLNFKLEPKIERANKAANKHARLKQLENNTFNMLPKPTQIKPAL